MPAYWFGVQITSAWKPGAPWQMAYPDGKVTDAGTILEMEPPKRLRLQWQHQLRPELKQEGVAECLLELEPVGQSVRLTVTHSIAQPQSQLIQAVSGGWPKILSNLKSLLETGEIVLETAAAKAG
ncbi:MAG: SRPBCC domain-containing protein [Acidobacteriota bacterium]|nr:SRPBCC domain-containing protein [Acidobacteriota bacterium]